MSSIDLLPPENFLEAKRKEIANRCFKNLPQGTKDKLEDDFKAAKNGAAADLIAFLRGDGAVIWERYVREIGRRESGRDFSPLDLSERESFRERIEQSFQNADLSETREIAKVSTRRIWWGLTMLLVGFSIIGTTYYVIPYIGSTIYQKRQEEIQAKVSPQLRTIKETIGEQTDVNRELLRLSDALALLESFENDLSSMANLINALKPLNAAADKASLALESNTETLKTNSDAVKTTLDQFTTSITPVAAEGDKPATPVKDMLAQIGTKIDNSLAPESLQKLIADLSAATKEFEEIEKPLTEELKNALEGSYIETDRYLYITESRNKALKAVLDPESKQEALSARIENLRKIFGEQLAKLPNITSVIETSEKEKLEGIAVSFSALGKAIETLNKSLTEIKAASDSLKSAAKDFETNETIKNDAATVFDKISAASHVIGEATKGYKKIASATQKIEQAAQSLDDISELQAGLAYRGTAPAVIMLFAIGGMFVTFGLSSLLKWMKLSERAEETGEHRNNLLLMSELGALLIEHGIEPSAFLDRIQSTGAKRDENTPISPQLPVSVTLAEIAKMFNGK